MEISTVEWVSRNPKRKNTITGGHFVQSGTPLVFWLVYRPIELVRCIPFIFPKLFYSIKFSYQHKSATNQLIIMKSAIKIHLPPSSGIWARSEVCTSPKQRGGLKCWMGNAFGKSQKKSWRTVEKNIINDNDIHEGS